MYISAGIGSPTPPAIAKQNQQVARIFQHAAAKRTDRNINKNAICCDCARNLATWQLQRIPGSWERGAGNWQLGVGPGDSSETFLASAENHIDNFPQQPGLLMIFLLVCLGSRSFFGSA